ncbi:MAG: monoheme cytochrome C [Bacteroidia bacterium]|nr:monoheme cytochrome C [Bacteroidia bacterium]
MEKKNFATEENKLLNLTMLAMGITFLGLLAGFMIIFILQNPDFGKADPDELAKTEESQEDLIVDGKDQATGFVAEGDYLLVKTTCTACHSSKLVLQNRATREGWKEMIVWMQETQKLWDLGENEDKILDYLAKYQGPVKKGRRSPLEVEEWYVIE